MVGSDFSHLRWEHWAMLRYLTDHDWHVPMVELPFSLDITAVCRHHGFVRYRKHRGALMVDLTSEGHAAMLDHDLRQGVEMEPRFPSATGERIPSKERPALQEIDMEILMALKDRHPVTVTQHDLEQACNRPRRTIGKHLVALRKYGLSYRPKGNRGGEGITKAGLAALESLCH